MLDISTYSEKYAQSIDEPEIFWAEAAVEIQWALIDSRRPMAAV